MNSQCRPVDQSVARVRSVNELCNSCSSHIHLTSCAMDTTSTIASLIGLYFMAAGTGLLVDRDFPTRVIAELRDQAVLGFLGGIVVFVIGGSIVAVHNDWSSWLAGLVSLVGWVALAEGVLILAFRKWFLGLFSGFELSPRLITAFGAGTTGLGLLLIVAAFAS